MHESDWRPLLGAHFDRLIQRGFFKVVTLDTVRDPDSRSLLGHLSVRVSDQGTYIGVSDDPHAPPRTLTISDVQGYQLDLEKVLSSVRSALSLNGPCVELHDGVWNLGTRTVGAHDLRVWLATQPPSEAVIKILTLQIGKERPILLVPSDCSASIAMPQLSCRIPIGPYDTLFGELVQTLGLDDLVPLPEWRTEEFLLDHRVGMAWYRGVPLTELSASSQPFRFAYEVARADGAIVTSGDLGKRLSPANPDPQVAKKAKAYFIKNAKASFEKAGQSCPDDLGRLFESRGGGYYLAGTAYVRG